MQDFCDEALWQHFCPFSCSGCTASQARRAAREAINQIEEDEGEDVDEATPSTVAIYARHEVVRRATAIITTGVIESAPTDDERCLGAGGMGQIVNPPESKRLYSSSFPDEHTPDDDENPATMLDQFGSMLYSDDSWSADNNAPGEWMQIDIGATLNITAVVIQARSCVSNSCDASNPQRVTEFQLLFANNPNGPFADGGNYSVSTDKTNLCELISVQTGAAARYLRFVVIDWNGHISMRAGVVVGSTANLQLRCDTRAPNEANSPRLDDAVTDVLPLMCDRGCQCDHVVTLLERAVSGVLEKTGVFYSFSGIRCYTKGDSSDSNGLFGYWQHTTSASQSQDYADINAALAVFAATVDNYGEPPLLLQGASLDPTATAWGGTRLHLNDCQRHVGLLNAFIAEGIRSDLAAFPACAAPTPSRIVTPSPTFSQPTVAPTSSPTLPPVCGDDTGSYCSNIPNDLCCPIAAQSAAVPGHSAEEANVVRSECSAKCCDVTCGPTAAPTMLPTVLPTAAPSCGANSFPAGVSADVCDGVGTNAELCCNELIGRWCQFSCCNLVECTGSPTSIPTSGPSAAPTTTSSHRLKFEGRLVGDAYANLIQIFEVDGWQIYKATFDTRMPEEAFRIENTADVSSPKRYYYPELCCAFRMMALHDHHWHLFEDWFRDGVSSTAGYNFRILNNTALFSSVRVYFFLHTETLDGEVVWESASNQERTADLLNGWRLSLSGPPTWSPYATPPTLAPSNSPSTSSPTTASPITGTLPPISCPPSTSPITPQSDGSPTSNPTTPGPTAFPTTHGPTADGETFSPTHAPSSSTKTCTITGARDLGLGCGFNETRSRSSGWNEQRNLFDFCGEYYQLSESVYKHETSNLFLQRTVFSTFHRQDGAFRNETYWIISHSTDSTPAEVASANSVPTDLGECCPYTKRALDIVNRYNFEPNSEVAGDSAVPCHPADPAGCELGFGRSAITCADASTCGTKENCGANKPGYSLTGICYCDHACFIRGDCCDDVRSKCEIEDQTHSPTLPPTISPTGCSAEYIDVLPYEQCLSALGEGDCVPGSRWFDSCNRTCSNCGSLRPTGSPTSAPTKCAAIVDDPSFVDVLPPDECNIALRLGWCVDDPAYYRVCNFTCTGCSVSPTMSPSTSPSTSPSKSPTTSVPTFSPTASPSLSPSVSPTTAPSLSPSVSPTTAPSFSPLSAKSPKKHKKNSPKNRQEPLTLLDELHPTAYPTAVPAGCAGTIVLWFAGEVPTDTASFGRAIVDAVVDASVNRQGKLLVYPSDIRGITLTETNGGSSLRTQISFKVSLLFVSTINRATFERLARRVERGGILTRYSHMTVDYEGDLYTSRRVDPDYPCPKTAESGGSVGQSESPASTLNSKSKTSMPSMAKYFFSLRRLG